MQPYYQDESVTLYHGDVERVLPEIDLSGVALTLTDPPYNVGLDYSDGDNRADYAEWTARWFRLVPRPLVVTPGIVNLALWFQMEAPTWPCVWVKPNQCSPSALNGFNTWEPVLVYGRPGKPIGQDAWVRNIRTNQRDTGDHPCPKFLPFWQELLGRFSKPADLILDPFCGSGTTARAAKNLGRRVIAVEKERRYCDLIVRRLQQQVLPLEVA